MSDLNTWCAVGTSVFLGFIISLIASNLLIGIVMAIVVGGVLGLIFTSV